MPAENMGTARGSVERRALNMIWTAAGDYTLTPGFVAYLKDGSPDLYFNTIMGFAYGHYGAQELDDYLMYLGHCWLGAVLVDMFWLGLEHATYQRCYGNMLTLDGLRQAWAADYLDDSHEDSMQYLMMRQELSHSLKKARCLEIQGKNNGLLNPWEKGLYKGLYFQQEQNLPELKENFQQLIKKYFMLKPKLLWQPSHWHLMLGAGLSQLLRRIMPMEHQGKGATQTQAGRLREKSAQMSHEEEKGKQEKNWYLPEIGSKSAAKELAEIKAIYPVGALGESKRLEIEQQVCVGNHRYSHIYLAGTATKGEAYRDNYGHFLQQGRKYRRIIEDLSHGLQNSLQLAKGSYSARAGQGQLAADLAWQGLINGDERIFRRPLPEQYQEFSVVLLLDGSYSRHSQQKQLSAQSYVIAESMRRCGIPTTVLSYSTIGSYTVLQVLKAKEQDVSGIWNYEARGWNRDGLALNTLGQYLGNDLSNSLIFMLTDMMPSDEKGLPMAGLKSLKQYTEEAAIADTETALQGLRKEGARLAGIIQTVVPFQPALPRRLFGRSYVHIQSLNQLSRAIVSLVDGYIQQQI